ncbi:MAG: RluA family pseudouridine synthase, partial [Candidatus Saccharimonadales bacterium]
LIKKGKVKVNKKVLQKPGYKLHQGDRVVVDYNSRVHEQIPDIELPILYEDEDCIIINKPPGILTHSKGVFNPEATVASWLKGKIKDGFSGERGGIVHRLDRPTSGVMITAKTPEALSWLQKQFSSRKVLKTYYAIVSGKMPHEQAIIDMPVMRNPKRPQTFRTGSSGKPAVTEYNVKGRNNIYSLLELHPETGRTHQLRVHLSSVGHPIIGDKLYGGAEADRLYLHACQLELTLPDRKRKKIVAPLPEEFEEMMKL